MDISDIMNLQIQAEECLEKTREFILQNTIKADNGWGLDRNLEEFSTADNAGIYGTACGIRTLLTCGEPVESYILEKYQKLLRFKQVTDGGWTLNSLRSKEILTTATCYAINALMDSGEDPSSDLIKDGIDWLIRNQNKDDGWGLFKNEISRTVPTAHVIATLSRFPEKINSKCGVNGISWLIKARNNLGRWSLVPQQNSENWAGVTSLVVLSLKSRFSYYSPYIQSPVNMLLDYPIENMATGLETFSVGDYSVIYHLPTQCLSLMALLTADKNLAKEKTLYLVKSIIDKQDNKGYWVNPTVEDKIPIWATMYACLALKDFNRKVDKLRFALVLQEVHKKVDILYQNTGEKECVTVKIKKWFSKVVHYLLSILKTSWPMIIGEIVLVIAVYIIFNSTSNSVTSTVILVAGLVFSIAIPISFRNLGKRKLSDK